MSNLTSSIVRGFGFTLGRMAAQSAVESLNKEPNKKFYNNTICYSELGFEEGDTDIKFDYNSKTYRGVGSWILILLGAAFWCVVPYLNIILWLLALRSYSKDHYMHFYKMVYKTFRYTDRRFKNGLREETRLVPVYEISKIDPTYPKTFFLIGISICIAISIYITYLTHLYFLTH